MAVVGADINRTAGFVFVGVLAIVSSVVISRHTSSSALPKKNEVDTSNLTGCGARHCVLWITTAELHFMFYVLNRWLAVFGAIIIFGSCELVPAGSVGVPNCVRFVTSHLRAFCRWYYDQGACCGGGQS